MHFTLPTRGPFSLDSARTLQCGCMRASRTCSATSATFAFPLETTFDVVGASVTHTGDVLQVTATGTRDQPTLATQLARVLAVDHDGSAFARVLAADPALAQLAAARPGFRPVVFFSAYVAAGWHVLAHRISMAQAGVVQAKLARALGDVAIVDGVELPSFPRPQSLLASPGFPGIPAEKWARLQGVARAALEGKLAVERLSAMSPDEALADLRQLRGIGPSFAEAILYRGCGPVDALTLSEQALHQGVQAVYGLPSLPSDAEVRRIAETWRPFRMWVTILVVSEAFRRGVRTPPRRFSAAGKSNRHLPLAGR